MQLAVSTASIRPRNLKEADVTHSVGRVSKAVGSQGLYSTGIAAFSVSHKCAPYIIINGVKIRGARRTDIGIDVMLTVSRPRLLTFFSCVAAAKMLLPYIWGSIGHCCYTGHEDGV